MKKYLKYLLWFVPTISFVISFVVSSLFVLYIDSSNWILEILLLVIVPVSIYCSYILCLCYFKKDNDFSEKFKFNYKLISGAILGIVLATWFIWSIYSFSDIDATTSRNIGA